MRCVQYIPPPRTGKATTTPLPGNSLARGATSLSTQPVAYLAADGFIEELRHELCSASAACPAPSPLAGEFGRLLVAPGPPRDVAWAQNIWFEPRRLPIESIGDAARQLRALQRNWALYSFDLHRRAKLIAERLPHVSFKRQVFGAPPPPAHLGSWTLLDEHTLLASARCSSPWPNGALEFVEDKEGPPNRAYVKLWEACTRLGCRPTPGELCLDLGSSPGGWTWALAALGCRVISVDGAPLAPAVAALPNVRFEKRDAFALEPAEIGAVDWLFSDVVCYPARLLELVRAWIDSGLCRRMICTIKFQGPTDHAIVREFRALPGAQLMHLHHNKHELTFARV